MSRRKSKAEAVAAGERTVAESFREYGRGVAGGLMFSLPLLYTMEVWWAGFSAHPLRLLAYLLATFVLLLGYNRYAGLRRDATMTEVAIDSVEELGLGLILSALFLALLGRITLEMPASEIVGRVVIEAMTIAVGVSVGTAQLGGGDEGDEGFAGDAGGRGGENVARKKTRGKDKAGGQGSTRGDGQKEIHFGGQMTLAVCGAFLFAANVAPTEEIVLMAVECTWLRLLGLAVVSLVIGSFILYYSGFKGAQELVQADGFGAALLGTVITYAVALVVSAAVLWFFGRFEGVTLYTSLAQTVVLGVAATLGASAGRLLLQ
ncbi:MAG TPA: TIGR02587 family membrane protein [Pyrinomonadaceae bacterium]|nr:TIGR02587 family membrane protein [Pyrinomonadaceae bacterium]